MRLKARCFEILVWDLMLLRFAGWSHELRPKKPLVSVAVPPSSVRVPSQRPLALSVASVVYDKGDNEMIPGAVHRSPGICLRAEENPRKPQLGDRLMKGLCDQSSSQMGSLPTMRSVGSHSTSGREKEGKKERTGSGQEHFGYMICSS